MSQEIEITIDGKNGKVLPETVVGVLSAIFETLQSIDEHSWNVGTQRLRWRISSATLKNPLTISAVGEMILEDVATPNIIKIYTDGVKQVANKKRPIGFTVDDIRRLKDLGAQAKNNRNISIVGFNGKKTPALAITTEIFSNAQSILDTPKRIAVEYGSLEGTLISISNDPQKNDAQAKLRERHSGNEVSCWATPETAARMAVHLDRATRVVLYGDITMEDSTARKIRIEDFTSLPSNDNLPTLEDLHALKLRPPGKGKSVDALLQELRPDE